MVNRRTPGQRAGLSRERVLAAAHELLGEYGLDGLTMRALAQRLDVAPNALYSYVPNKTALIDEVLDDVLAEVETPPTETGVDPTAGLQSLMASTYRVLLRHRDLVPSYLARQGARGPHAQHLGEVMLALLAAEGVHGERAREALRVLIIYTIGFAAFGASPVDPDAALPPAALERNFDSGLRWLLAGITSAPQPDRDHA